MSDTLLKRVEGRVLASSDDRAAWLEARRGVATATEVKQLALAAQSSEAKLAQAVKKIVAEKMSGKTLPDNIYFAYGRQREPHILHRLGQTNGISPAGFLIAAEANPRHAATPDGWGYDFDHGFLLCEIKTSKDAVFPGSKRFDQTGYFYQMQWQIYCVGAEGCLYVVETHDNDFSRWDKHNPASWLPETAPKPVPVLKSQKDALAVFWVERDEETIAQLVRYADLLLEAMSESTVFSEPVSRDSTAEVQMAGFIQAWVDISREEKRLKQRKEELRRTGLELARAHDVAKVSTDCGSFTYTPASVKRVQEVDEDAAKIAHPDLFAALEAAQQAWQGVLAGFTVEVEKPVAAEVRYFTKQVKEDK